MLILGNEDEHKNADVAKLADAQVSGSCGRPYGFESLHPHQANAPLVGAFLRGADEVLTWFHRVRKMLAFSLPRLHKVETASSLHPHRKETIILIRKISVLLWLFYC